MLSSQEGAIFIAYVAPVYGKIFEWENFCGFSVDRESFPLLRGICKTAWSANLIITACLAYPVICASLGHLLIA